MSPEVLPVSVAIRFSHAVVQSVADRRGLDVLHIKGPAVQAALLAPDDDQQGERRARVSHDADVLVRPSQVGELIGALGVSGWLVLHTFEEDSVFGHAATLVHESLGHLDVHRYLPGMDRDPENAFEMLWRERETAIIAGRPCLVPSITGNRLILILNAGRNGRSETHPDLAAAWVQASDDERGQVERLAEAVHADTALAAVTGGQPRINDPEYALWRLMSEGEQRSLRFFVALVRAQPDVTERVRMAVRMVRRRRGRVLAALADDRSYLRSYSAQLKHDAQSIVRDLRRSVSGRSRG